MRIFARKTVNATMYLYAAIFVILIAGAVNPSFREAVSNAVINLLKSTRFAF